MCRHGLYQKALTKNCAGCRLRHQNRREQLMVPLPASRLKPRAHVIAYATINLAGPFNVAVGTSSARHWICLFVCMVTMTFCIEVYIDHITSTLLNAFQKFWCSTGFHTKLLLRDNGTKFARTNNLLQCKIKVAFKVRYAFKELHNKMEEWEIQLEFGSPEACHHGGLSIHLYCIYNV